MLKRQVKSARGNVSLQSSEINLIGIQPGIVPITVDERGLYMSSKFPVFVIYDKQMNRLIGAFRRRKEKNFHFKMPAAHSMAGFIVS